MGGDATDDLPHRDAFQRATGVGQQQTPAVSPVFEAGQRRAQLVEVAPGPVLRGPAHGDQSLLGALARHHQHAEREVVVGQTQGRGLAGAQSRGVHQFQQRLVAQPQATRAGLGRRQQRPHLLRREHAGQALPAGGRLEQTRGIVVDRAVGLVEAEEHANGGEMPRDRAGLEAAPPVQIADVLGQVVRRDIVRHGQPAGSKVVDQVVQVAGIRVERGGRQARLDTQIREKLTYRSRGGAMRFHRSSP